MNEAEKEEHQKVTNEIRGVLEKLGIPIAYEDGNGYFEVVDPTVIKD